MVFHLLAINLSGSFINSGFIFAIMVTNFIIMMTEVSGKNFGIIKVLKNEIVCIGLYFMKFVL